jgi:hypothetical protein
MIQSADNLIGVFSTRVATRINKDLLLQKNCSLARVNALVKSTSILYKNKHRQDHLQQEIFIGSKLRIFERYKRDKLPHW